ncbi:MAG TPA: hypothetical protein VLM89_09115, partial [Phycisphaerae bacterium]|nr:hypothetical protein [Phycisphaerae bacterium]
WLVNAAAIVLIDPSILSDDHDHVRDPDQLLLLTIPLVGVITSYAFGWLYSSRLKSPAIAAAGSLGTITAMILFTQSMRGYRPELIDHSLPVLLFVAAPLLALGAFTTGIGWYLRRTEP